MKLRQFIGAAVSALFMAGHAQALAQEPIVLNLSNWLPQSHLIVKDMIVPWAERVEKATEGRVKMKILPKALGAPSKHFDIARTGQADLAWGVYGYQPERFSAYLMAELPLVGGNAVEKSIAFWRVHERHLHKSKQHQGVVLLGAFTHGPGMIHHTGKPLLKAEDFKGQKIRVGGDVPRALVKELGGVPISKPGSQVYDILSKGVADGATFPLETVVAFKIAPIVRHSTSFDGGGLYATTFFFVMNEGKFNKLSKTDQKAVMAASGEVFSRTAASWDVADEAAKKVVTDGGGKIHEAPAELHKAVADIGRNLEAEWIEKVKKFGIDGKQALADFRDEIAKVKSGN